MFFRLVLVSFLLACFTINYSQEYELKLTESEKLYFSSQIDSLMERDKKVRKGKYFRASKVLKRYKKNPSLNKTNKKYIKAKELIDEWSSVDSSNVYHLIKLIDKFGYPSKEKVGYSNYNSAFVLLFHFDDDTNSIVLMPILNLALRQKEISPFYYAMIVDRHLCYGGKKPIYYCWCFCDYPSLSIEEKKIISENRKRIGLKPMVAKCGTFKKKFLIE